MRLATINTPRGLRLHVRARSGYVDVADATGESAFAALDGLLTGGPAAMDAARALTDSHGAEFEQADFGPAVPEPRRILCLGVNYREHAIEGGREVPTWPEAFVRGEGSALGPYADLVRPALTSRFDYEGELGLVIGAGGRYIPADKALDAIAGYVVVNDATARDWQRAATQWTGGKNFTHLLAVANALGHRSIGIDVDFPFYVDICATLRIDRRTFSVTAGQKLPTSGLAFDDVTAIAITLNYSTTYEGVIRRWSSENWQYFVDDVKDNQLRDSGILILAMNNENISSYKSFFSSLEKMVSISGSHVFVVTSGRTPRISMGLTKYGIS